ncbi:MAG: hypothetical protein LC649_00460 [Bacteroidales bacterium]|nr:hypothetical protein [Bacteroidales bacterium]
MITKIALTPLIIIMGIMASGKGCTVKSESNHDLFTVKDISYQSWTRSNGERGTDLTVVVTDADSLVLFQSITFRGLTVPVTTVTNDGTVTLKATLATDFSMVENYDYESTGGPDRLTFTYREEEYNWPVKNIKRLQSKFR